MIDFTTPNTLIWAANCTYAVTNASCSEVPTNVNTVFAPTNTTTLWLRKFENMWWGGYNVTGNVFLTEVCSWNNEFLCRIVEIYSGEVINSDKFMTANDSSFVAGSGYIGMGFESDFWYGFVDYNSSQVNYTVSGQYIGSSGPQQGVNIAVTVPDYYNTTTPTIFESEDVDVAAFEYDEF